MSNEREAMARIQAYLNERVPVRGIDQELIHCMNDKELRVSDIAALLAARQSAGATGEEPVGTLSIHRFRKIDSMVNHDFEYYGSLPDGTYRVYVAPIGDNGVKASHDVIWPEPGDTDTVSFDAQPAESKRVELTDEEIGHLRLIVSFCETLSSIERGSYADDALRALRLFLARASAKGA